MSEHDILVTNMVVYCEEIIQIEDVPIVTNKDIIMKDLSMISLLFKTLAKILIQRYSQSLSRI